jgi:hypothetical protein
VVNNNGLILGNITVGTGVLVMTTSSSSGITQSSAGNRVVAGGVATFIANNGGPIGPVILNNAQNSFGDMVNAYGTRVVIRNSASTGLELGNVTASTSLTATSSSAGITQSGLGINSTGAASFAAAAGQSILLSNAGNVFGSTASFSALSGQLLDITVVDSTALQLGGSNITGNLIATGSGLTQTTGTTLLVGGTSTLTAGAGNNITLDNANNFGGEVRVVSGNNVTLNDIGAFTFGNAGTSTISGNLVLTTAGAITDTQAVLITGTTSLTAGAGNNITLDNANNFGGEVRVVSGNNVTLNDIGAFTFGNGGTSTISGNLDVTANGVINQTEIVNVGGTSTLAAGAPNNIDLSLGNSLGGSVTIVSANNLTLRNISSAALFPVLSASINNLILTYNAAPVVIPAGLPNVGGNLNLTGLGITQSGAFTAPGTLTLNGLGGAIVLNNSGNNYTGLVTITGGASADMFFSLADQLKLGAVTTTGSFTLRTESGKSFGIGDGTIGDFQVSDSKLENFQVGTFAPIATGGGDLDLGNLTSYPGIGGISLTTEGGGDINARGVINLNTLELNSSGGATFSEVNRIQNLGNVTVAVGGVAFQNSRGLNLTGIVTIPTGRLSLEVAGQFYNQTGSATPLAGVQGGSVVKSLSLMGGLPNQVSGLAGFSYRYDGQMPTSGNVMSYAVSPLTMFAPGGTTIAGVNLGGTQTGGGQFNTFLTGSDNLNWMISDFGRFDMPTVKPSGMEYILYPQRVEPETRTLPAATLGQLERELGRPPTLEEIQVREVAVRESAMVRSGAILERSSFDAEEDEVDKQESAEVPVQVIDGGKPQAGGPSFAPSPASAGGASEGFGPQARKTQSVRQGSNGPILRSGPIRSVAQLRPAEPAEGTSAGKTAIQAVHLDAKSVMEQERASAEVGIAPPIASGR